MFGSALAGMPFAPVNYRLGDEQLRAILQRLAPAVAVVDDDVVGRLGELDGVDVVTAAEFAEVASSGRHDRRGTGRPRRRRHPAVHQRDDRRAEGRRAPPSPPHVLHPVDGRVPRRRRRRGAAGQRARLPRRRHLGGAQLGVRRTTHLLPARLRHGGLGAGRRTSRRSPRRWSCRRCSAASSTRSSAPGVTPGAAPPLLRRRAHAGPGDRAGDAAAPRRPLGQRLRADRDQLDDRRARTRGPPHGLRQRRPHRPRPARLRRPTAAVGRAGDPRSRRQRAARPASRARSTCAASRSPASTSAGPC